MTATLGGNVLEPHHYNPDPMMQGDCRVCGHGQESPLHTVRRAGSGKLHARDLLDFASGKPAQSGDIAAALAAFSKAVNSSEELSLAIQRHEPCWKTWKSLCDAVAARSPQTVTPEAVAALFNEFRFKRMRWMMDAKTSKEADLPDHLSQIAEARAVIALVRGEK